MGPCRHLPTRDSVVQAPQVALALVPSGRGRGPGQAHRGAHLYNRCQTRSTDLGAFPPGKQVESEHQVAHLGSSWVRTVLSFSKTSTPSRALPPSHCNSPGAGEGDGTVGRALASPPTCPQPLRTHSWSPGWAAGLPPSPCPWGRPQPGPADHGPVHGLSRCGRCHRRS